MTRTAEAIPNKDMLVWARKRSAMPLDIAAKKIQIQPEKLMAWESGEQRPTIAQLRKLGDLYRRPLAAFYLPVAPALPPKLRDLRLFPGTLGEIDWINLTKEERIARERRAIVLDLLETEGNLPPVFEHTARLDNNPESVGQQIRKILGITLQEQKTLAGPDEAFRFWRTALEASGVLVFQSTKIDLITARGFSIPEFPLPIIVINRKDSPRARVFTMLHEFAHVLLRIGGVCDLDYHDGRLPEEQRIEVFCNHAAGAALVPRDVLSAMPVTFNKRVDWDWEDKDIEYISKQFGVSREVIARRLLILGKVSPLFYESKRDMYQLQYKTYKNSRTKGFITPPMDVVSSAGKHYVSLVLTALYNDRISPRDVSNYLGVRLKHLPRIEQLVGLG